MSYPTNINRFRRRLAGLVFLVFALVTLAVTLVPFQFQTPTTLVEGGVAALWRELLRGYSQSDDVLNNIMLFLPLGGSLAAYLWLRGAGVVLMIGLPVICGGSLSMGIEVLQLFLPARIASLVDVVTNMTGALVGALCIWLAGSWAMSRRTLVIGMIAYLTLVVAAVAQLQDAAGLDSWDPEYHLLIGNEGNGRRAWSGTVSDVRAAAVGLSAEEAQQLLRGERVAAFEEELVFDYPLRGRLDDLSGRAPALEWRPGRESNVQPPQPEDGVTTGPGAYLRSVAPMVAAVGAARASDRFTLTATITPGAVDQHGPARIVSLSHNNSLRNLTLGHEGDDLVVRLRTASNGQNGTRQLLRAPGLFAAAETRQIVVTYAGARLALYSDGFGEVTAVEVLPEAAALGWLFPGELAQAIEALPSQALVTGGWLFVHGLMGLSVGVTLAWMTALAGTPRAAPAAWAAALVGAGALPALIELAMAAIGGREPRGANVLLALTLATSALVYFGLRTTPQRRLWR